jgi:hypothetical protein
MRLFFRRWRPRHLFFAWLAYWIGLILVTLWPAIIAGWRLSRPNGHGSANASFTNGVLNANLVDAGRTIWAGSVSFSTLVLFLAIPPLVLWLVWLMTASRTNNAEEIGPTNRTRQKELAASDRTLGMNEPLSQTSIRQRREES